MKDWKQVENSNILQPWWVIAWTSVLPGICSVATALINYTLSGQKRLMWKVMRTLFFSSVRSNGSICKTHTHTHFFSALIHTYPVLSMEQHQENGTKHCNLEDSSKMGMLTLSLPFEESRRWHLWKSKCIIGTVSSSVTRTTLQWHWSKNFRCQRTFPIRASLKFNMFEVRTQVAFYPQSRNAFHSLEGDDITSPNGFRSIH